MTIIVDTNATHLLFNGDITGAKVFDLISCGKVIYITEGTHKDEILNGGMKRKMYQQLQLAGRLKEYPKSTCDDLESNFRNSSKLVSDDPHIIALATISGCRLLYSFDKALCEDFKNKSIIDEPRGKIIQSEKNLNLTRNVPKPK